MFINPYRRRRVGCAIPHVEQGGQILSHDDLDNVHDVFDSSQKKDGAVFLRACDVSIFKSEGTSERNYRRVKKSLVKNGLERFLEQYDEALNHLVKGIGGSVVRHAWKIAPMKNCPTHEGLSIFGFPDWSLVAEVDFLEGHIPDYVYLNGEDGTSDETAYFCLSEILINETEVPLKQKSREIRRQKGWTPSESDDLYQYMHLGKDHELITDPQLVPPLVLVDIEPRVVI
ncbi:hypothetical protein KC992_02620 [Candidatus Saccharibacteria bacterium]|nr:hypothetical protein [Candidatus Saccharibacteria bacterium]MCA9328537.1 hypothetical protein [Candidatus Saccharibacteria bacterium]